MAKKKAAPKKGIGVYDIRQAEQIGGKFNKSVSRLVDTRKSTHAYADSVNDNFKNSGKYLELNDKRNEEYLEAVKAKVSPKVEKKSTKK